MNPRPSRDPRAAAAEAMWRVGRGTYRLGALDQEAKLEIFDCSSFAIRHCYGIPGHRPGFNTGWGVDWSTGATATVVDDINSNSAIEDAMHARDLFRVVDGAPMPGDILAYPTIRLPGMTGPAIGHAAICVGVARAKAKWDWTRPAFELLDIVECHGPNGTTPAIRQVSGAVFSDHSNRWPKPQHRSWLLRVLP